MVSEEEFVVAMVCALLFGAWTLYLLIRNRGLKKRLKWEMARSTAIMQSMSHAPAKAPKTRDDDVADLRKRIQVLERITVDKEHSLAREIEELRHAG